MRAHFYTLVSQFLISCFLFFAGRGKFSQYISPGYEEAFFWAFLIFLGIVAHHIWGITWGAFRGWRSAKRQELLHAPILSDTELHLHAVDKEADVKINMNFKCRPSIRWVDSVALLHMEPDNFDEKPVISEIYSDNKGMSWTYINYESTGSAIFLELSGWRTNSHLLVKVMRESDAYSDRRHTGPVIFQSTENMLDFEASRAKELREAARSQAKAYTNTFSYRIRNLFRKTK